MNRWEKFALLAALLFVILAWLCGCVSIPSWVAESAELEHNGNIIICGDYVELVVERYKGEERQNKLQLIEKHLKLSKELNDYCQEHKND